MRVSPDLLEATKASEPDAQGMINLWSHAAHAHYPGNPGPGFWVAGGNLRLLQRQKPGVLHADFAACESYRSGLERAAQVKCPALLVLGRLDAMTPARVGRDLAGAIPNSMLKTLHDSGHNLMGEKPDEVLDALVEFLRA
jgi:pimeloyl-ACP methyl ester carboxylesterase